MNTPEEATGQIQDIVPDVKPDIFEFATRYINEWMINLGLSEKAAKVIADFSGFLIVIFIALLVFYIAEFVIVKAVHRLAIRSKTNWDDVFMKRKVFKRLAYLVPAIVINAFTPYIIPDYPHFMTVIHVLIGIYIETVILIVILSVLNAANDIYSSYEISLTRPIKGFIQVIKIVFIILYIIVLISLIFLRGQGFGWLAGLGAFSAVLLLVFKDPILGFAGGVQLATNDMLRIGDWIEMPKYGADGTVLDITITTVKVQNWDKTITTIPIYALVSDSYKNWRGMEESGVRRIKRSVMIDINSILFCSPEMLKRFKKFEHVAEYVRKTEEDINAYNAENKVDPGILVNGKRQTNIGVFRAYLTSYLKANPYLNKEMSILVRHLQPTENGLPLEIIAYCNEQDMELYEKIQSDIFDHVHAVISFFDLRLFQNPTGRDFRQILTEKP